MRLGLLKILDSMPRPEITFAQVKVGSDPVEPVRLSLIGLLCCALALVFASGFGQSEADAHYSLKGGRECRSVGHGWASDNVSSNVQVRGRVGCRKARSWIRQGSGGTSAILNQGWICERRVRQGGDRVTEMAHADFRCIRGGKRIVWSSF